MLKPLGWLHQGPRGYTGINSLLFIDHSEDPILAVLPSQPEKKGHFIKEINAWRGLFGRLRQPNRWFMAMFNRFPGRLIALWQTYNIDHFLNHYKPLKSGSLKTNRLYFLDAGLLAEPPVLLWQDTAPLPVGELPAPWLGWQAKAHARWGNKADLVSLLSLCLFRC